MEEILASIRRIIADDEAKPAKVSEPAPAAAPAMFKEAPSPAVNPSIDSVSAERIEPRFEPAAMAPSPSQSAREEFRPSLDAFDMKPSISEPSLSAVSETDTSATDYDFYNASIAAAMAEPDEAPAAPLAAQQPVAPEPQRFAPEPQRFEAYEEPAVQYSPVFEQPAADQRQWPHAHTETLLSSHTGEAVSSAFNSLAHTVLTQNAQTLDDLVREMLRPMLKSWLDDNLPTVVERLVRAEIERVSRGR